MLDSYILSDLSDEILGFVLGFTKPIFYMFESMHLLDFSRSLDFPHLPYIFNLHT